MASIKDDRGYNQGFKPSKALSIRTERRCDYMISQMTAGQNTKILEIGCGTGEISYLLAKKTGAITCGSDICLPFVEEARKNFVLDNLKYEILDFNNTEHVKNIGSSYDYVVGNGILHHLYYNLDNVLENIKSLLSQNGKIIFLEPNIYNPYCLAIFKNPILRRLSHLEPDEMAFSKSFIKAKLTNMGFSEIEVDYKDFLLPNTPSPLINSVVKIGNVLERIPIIKMVSQSIFITASKK